MILHIQDMYNKFHYYITMPRSRLQNLLYAYMYYTVVSN